MDPITLIVTALAAGAAAGLKPTAERAVKDAYGAIKALIQRKYAAIDLAQLENRPESEPKRDSLIEDLRDVGASDDHELLEEAKALVETLMAHDRASAGAIGVNLDDVKAAFLNIGKVVSEGTGVNITGSEFKDGIEITDVQAGRTPNP